ncbi:MAG: dihydrolipoamide acetyltransferase family protein [Novosphingobium sp.]
MTSERPILMPKLGLTMTEGHLVSWNVAPGDAVRAGDVLFIVETDKISNEIEAQDDGTIVALLVSEDETVPVGTVVATMAVSGPPLADTPPQPAAPVSAKPPRLIATPLARRAARRAGIDLAKVAGSGPRGRITVDDVTAALGETAQPSARAEAPALPLSPPSQPQPAADRLPMDAHRRVLARRLSEAKRDIPHFYVIAEADVTALDVLREQLNSAHGQPRLTVSHFLLSALARALVALPEVNRVLDGDALVQLPSADIGLAVEGPKGLVAPVLRDLGHLALDEIAVATDQLLAAVRNGRLPAEALVGGATALSNVGMFGATALIPIVNPGQSSILGVGRSRGEFKPDAAGNPCLRQMLTLALSCDHRVIDGALAARFLQTVQTFLEAPAALMRKPAEDTPQ